MTETLHEFFDSRGVHVQVDREAAVIRGVKILGLRSQNGRMYLPEALTDAARLYENAKVNVNHPKGHPNEPRDYRDRIGVIRNVVVRENEGLFGDFHFNPKHALAEQLVWDAGKAPENVGFSHNVQAKTSRRGKDVVVEAITQVKSVDLVADPATTQGLFESAAGNHPLSSLTIEQLKGERPDLVETLVESQAAELQSLREENDRLVAQEELQRKSASAGKLLREYGLPALDTADRRERAIIDEEFIESLLGADGESAMRGLVEQRATLVDSVVQRPINDAITGWKPQSRDQYVGRGTGEQSTKDFVAAIT